MCRVCYAFCFSVDIVAPFLPNKQPCEHGMCRSCVSNIVNEAIESKSLVSLFKCQKSGCKGIYEVSQFEALLEALEDPESKAKMSILYTLQGLHTFISKKLKDDILL